MGEQDTEEPRIVSEQLYRDGAAPWLSVYSDLVTPTEGEAYRTRHVELMDGQPGAVCVVVHDERVLMARLWRPAIRATSLEFPRGMGEPGESMVETALRELREETGIEAVRTVRELGVIHADTGLLSNAIGIVEVVAAEPGLSVGSELSDAAWVPLEEVVEAIAQGLIVDGITLAAWAVWSARS